MPAGFCFTETAHEPLHLGKLMRLGTERDHEHTYKFDMNRYFIWRLFQKWR
jgi:hypothetical protein